MCIDWVTVVATVLPSIVALVIAIWGEQLRTLFWKPKLSILFDPMSGDFQRTTLPDVAPTGQVLREVQTYYVRVRIKNIGKAIATSLELTLERVERQEADEQFRPIPGFLPLNLLRSFHQGTVSIPQVPREGERQFDVCHVVFPEERHFLRLESTPFLNTEPRQAILSLDTNVKPRTNIHPE